MVPDLDEAISTGDLSEIFAAMDEILDAANDQAVQFL